MPDKSEVPRGKVIRVGYFCDGDSEFKREENGDITLKIAVSYAIMRGAKKAVAEKFGERSYKTDLAKFYYCDGVLVTSCHGVKRSDIGCGIEFSGNDIEQIQRTAGRAGFEIRDITNLMKNAENRDSRI